MKILIFGTLYEPETSASAPLFSSLCKELVRSGHQVIVITPVPHYPSGRVRKPFRGRLLWRSIEEGVKVIRVGLPSLDRTKLPLRLFQFICYQLGAAWVALGQHYDVVLAGSPSLTVWLPFAVAVVLRKKPAVYSVQDLYPDVGIALGFFKNRFILTAVTAMEKFCFQNATIVQIISNSFLTGLHRMGVPDAKISLVHNWIDTEFIRPLPRLNQFSKEQALNEHFVVMYAGNIGYSQGLETVLAAAECLKNEKEILFVIIGDGSAKKALSMEAQTRCLSNVVFLPFQPQQLLPEVMATANVSLVPLRKGIEKGSLPSKLFTVLASGRPIIVCVEKESELWKLVECAKAGLHVPPEDPIALSRAVLTLKDQQKLCEEMGQNARVWAERHHSPQGARMKFEQLFLDAVRTKAEQSVYE